jgi:hypothetical protein
MDGFLLFSYCLIALMGLGGVGIILGGAYLTAPEVPKQLVADEFYEAGMKEVEKMLVSHEEQAENLLPPYEGEL